MVNLLVLQGRITRKFENKNGNAYSSLAVDTYKGDTMFIDIAVFGKNAEFCLNHLGKGSMVLVEGSLNVSVYQDRKFITCIVKTITSIGAKKTGNESDETITDEQVAEGVEEPSVSLDEIDTTDDNLPF